MPKNRFSRLSESCTTNKNTKMNLFRVSQEVKNNHENDNYLKRSMTIKKIDKKERRQQKLAMQNML